MSDNHSGRHSLPDLADIFEAYYDRIYSYALFRVQSIADAEDIASNVFLKAAEHIDLYDAGKASVSTWLFTIAQNTVKDHYRTRHTTVSEDEIEELPAGDDPEQRVLANERAKELYAAIAKLDERQRDIVLMRYYGGMSSKEIAAVLKLSETNAETILSRAKKILREILTKV